MTFKIKYKNGLPLPLDQQPEREVTNVAENPPPAEPIMAESQTEPEQIAQFDQIQTEETQPVVDKLSTTETPQENNSYEPETKKEQDLRKLRLKAARAEQVERERDELLKLLKQQQQPKNEPSTDDDGDINLAPDDLAEGKHLSKMDKKYKKLEQQLKQYQEEANQKNIENRIKAEYPDFDKVVSRDNLEMLHASFPEVGQTLATSPDLYSKAVTAYTLIRKLGINNEDMIDMERKKIASNLSKPKPVNSIAPTKANTPLDKANPFAEGLTKDLKAQLRKEMEIARKARW